ncbi:type II secretion system F family protein [Prosthecobacter vanneervenii]|uniref:Type II secretory pathway component PulF n=1 Tax=Prosthecobacter vanneervenii TaxID=48466 RepID=A0A7W7YBU7_9BACT|nr:type II secretion system F family protein [Prosthecobacter vanneervenii]MBB5033249.1 type II secretory pathway component PulF [Prosthecobacter vanneervenii]
MPTFVYSAQGPSGVITGELSASDRSEAFALLGKKKIQPFKLEAAGEMKTAAGSSAKARQTAASVPETISGPIKLKLPQVVLFIEELADLVGAGIQLEPALATMERRRELSGIKTLATVLRGKVRDGMAFSKAIAATSPSFGRLFCALVSAGEASGSLSIVLKRQAQYMRSLQALKSKVLSALMYPAFLIVAAVAVTLLFVVYLIPKLTEMLDSTGGSLPMAAQIILRFSDAFKSYWWMVLLGGTAAFILVKAWISRPESAIPWARFKLRLPLFGSIFRARFYVQFLETMANLLGNGLTMVQAMQLTHEATDNPHLRREFEGVMRHVAEGVALSRALDRSGQFPPLLIDMVNVGEQTGDMSGALSRAAERFDRELGKKIDTLAALIQPVIVCLMAGMVGTMAYLMMTTIFQTISSINK